MTRGTEDILQSDFWKFTSFIFYFIFIAHIRTEPCVVSLGFSTTIQTYLRWWESKNRVTILSAMEYHNWETKDDRNIYTFGEKKNNVVINYVWRVWITRPSRKAGFIQEKEKLLNRVSNSLFIPTWLYFFIICFRTKRPLQTT